MTTVALFPSVLGVRAGVLDAADRLRRDGHEVLVVDLYEGRTFDDYEPAMAFAEEELGHAELMRRAREGVADLPDGFVSAGFSLGCVMAVHIATQRTVSGVLMIAGALPASAFGTDARWPTGVPAQTHATLDDPWREQDMIDQAVLEVGGRRQHPRGVRLPGGRPPVHRCVTARGVRPGRHRAAVEPRAAVRPRLRLIARPLPGHMAQYRREAGAGCNANVTSRTWSNGGTPTE